MKYCFLIVIFITSFVSLNAQMNEQVDINTPTGRPISKATRISSSPVVKDTLTPKPNLTYQNESAFVKTSYSPAIINAAKLKMDITKEKLDKFYVRGGIGFYTTPLLDFYFNDGYNKNGTYGVKAHHFSSQGGVKNQGYPGFSDNSIGLFGKFFERKLEFGGALDYDRNVVHYYGYNGDSLYFDKEDIKQRFNKINTTLYMGTFTPDSMKLNHREEINYQYTDDHFGAMENRFQIGTSLSKIVNDEWYGLNFNFDYNNFVPTFNYPGCTDCLEQGELGATQNNVLLTLNPHVKSLGKNWNLKVGLILTGDFKDDGAKFHFYPDAEFRYSLFNDMFIPYVGVTGGMKRNNYRSLTTENPFMMSNIDLLNTNNKINIFGGIRGTISSTTSFNAQVSYLKTENLPLFYNDALFSIGNKFRVDYDSVDIINISGQMHYRQKERLKIFLRGDYFIYYITNALAAWNLPNFKFTLGMNYDMMDKIIVRADFYLVGSRDVLTYENVEGFTPVNGVSAMNLKPYVDLNLGVEYRYSSKISAFLNVYNFAAQKYQRYMNYPVQNINAILGFTMSF